MNEKSVGNIVFRRAIVSDAPSLKLMYEEPSVYSNTLQLPYSSEALWETRMQNASDQLHGFVAEVNGDIAGHLVLHTETNLRRRHVGSFGMAVRESYRGQGVGHTLLTSVLDYGENWLNLKRIEISVFTDNHAAIGLYQKNGFAKEGESPMFAYRAGEFVSVFHMARIRS